LTLTLTSSLTAAQITASSIIQTALKSAIAVMLEVDVSSVTGVTATAVARKKRTAAEAQRELDAGIIAIDWREHQAEDATRILGHGLQVAETSNGLVVKRINDLVWRRMAVSAVTITASVTSAYSSSALTVAQNAYSSVFQSAFTTAAASYGITVNEPTLTPTAAPTPTPTAAPTTPTAAPTPTPTAVTASTASSSTTIIIGVVVGVGGAILIAGGIYAAITSSNGAANSKMPVESSAHHKSGTGEDYSGGEVEVLAISHGDHHGAVDAESDTWQTSEHRPHAHPHKHI
jgi:hypothetical protein